MGRLIEACALLVGVALLKHPFTSALPCDDRALLAQSRYPINRSPDELRPPAEVGTIPRAGAHADDTVLLSLPMQDIAPNLEVAFRPSTQTIASIKARGDNFDYLPADGDFGANRTLPGFHALGDISLRVRPAGIQEKVIPDAVGFEAFPAYTTVTSVNGQPSTGVKVLPKEDWEFAVHDLTPQLNLPDKCPLKIIRRYARALDATGGLLMSFTLANADPYNTLEVGALGAALPFQGRWDGLSLEAMAGSSTFLELYQGGPCGWATVTRMTGRGPVLLVLPENGTSLEAWRWAREDAANAGPLGTPHWLAHSRAFQDGEWAGGGESWNAATSLVLRPGANATFGLRFALAPSVRQRDSALRAAGRAVVVGVPGYVLATDMRNAQLLVTLPAGARGLGHISVHPRGALRIGAPSPLRRNNATWAVPVYGVKHGRARVTLRYAGSCTWQSVQYFVLPPLRGHVAQFAACQAGTAFWGRAGGVDPFGRTPAVMPWDRETRRHITHDPRAFVVGLSDEAGAGASVGLAVAARHLPTQRRAAALDAYIQGTLWGVDDAVPFPISLQDHKTGGIRASLFWVPTPGSAEPGMPGYEYRATDFAGWIWNRTRAVDSLGRAYNYPHQTAVYWSMYRMVRDHDLLEAAREPVWYLRQALLTIQGMWDVARWYTQFGLMAGTVFREVLRDLDLEGLAAEAAFVRSVMLNRTIYGIEYRSSGPCPRPPGPCKCEPDPAGKGATFLCDPWAANPFPFGSEFAWDSTGQEEINVWARYFGLPKVAATALDAVLAFTPTMPNWAYNGAALGIGDFSNNAKYTPFGGGERVLQHYRAGLNAIPALETYRAQPDDIHLLLMALGGVTGQLTNIDKDGAASMAFHSDPSMLRHDPYSGDYGIGFFGHSELAGAYVTYGQLGADWLCFLCDFATNDSMPPQELTDSFGILPRDSLHQRVYIAPLGVYLVADTGAFREVQVAIADAAITVAFDPLRELPSTKLRLRWDVPGAAAAAVGAAVLATAPVPAVMPDPAPGGATVGQTSCTQRLAPAREPLSQEVAAAPSDGATSASSQGAVGAEAPLQRLQLHIAHIRSAANASHAAGVNWSHSGAQEVDIKSVPFVRGAYEFTPTTRDEVVWVGLTWAPAMWG